LVPGRQPPAGRGLSPGPQPPAGRGLSPAVNPPQAGACPRPSTPRRPGLVPGPQVAVARSGPLLRMPDEVCSHGIQVHVSDGLMKRLFIPDAAIVKTALPQTLDEPDLASASSPRQ